MRAVARSFHGTRSPRGGPRQGPGVPALCLALVAACAAPSAHGAPRRVPAGGEAALPVAPTPSATARSGGIPFTRLCGGDDAAYGAKKVSRAPEIAIARDPDEFRRVWAEDVTGAYRDLGGMPAVEWDRRFVVAVFLGARPLGGRAPEIEAVELRGRVLEVVMARPGATPAPSDPGRTVSPYAMVSCPRAGLPLAEILMLRLLGPDRRVLAERPAWSHRMMDTGEYDAGKGRDR